MGPFLAGVRMALGDMYPTYFQSVTTATTDTKSPSRHVDTSELLHYNVVLHDKDITAANSYSTNKEMHMYSLLRPLVGHSCDGFVDFGL